MQVSNSVVDEVDDVLASAARLALHDERAVAELRDRELLDVRAMHADLALEPHDVRLAGE